MFHDHLKYFQKPPLEGRPNTILVDRDTKRSQPLIHSILSHVKPYINKILLKGPVTYDFTLHLRVHDHTTMVLEVCWDALWTLSFGLSQFLGHGS